MQGVKAQAYMLEKLGYANTTSRETCLVEFGAILERCTF